MLTLAIDMRPYGGKPVKQTPRCMPLSARLNLRYFSQSTYRRPSGSSGGCPWSMLASAPKVYPFLRLLVALLHDLRDYPGTTSDGFLARPALPNPNRVSLHRGFAAECAGVSRVLSNLHLLNLFSEGSTISMRILISRSHSTLPRGPRLTSNDTEVVAVPYLVPYLPVTPTSRDLH